MTSPPVQDMAQPLEAPAPGTGNVALSSRIPWVFGLIFAASLVVQLKPSWRGGLLYDREAIQSGEWWRIWTGHLVHFGWPHFVADAGLFVILGWLLERRHRVFSYASLALMPAFICGALFWLDPSMPRYGGLSALNLGLLLYLAAQGWRRNWTDWFWPAVIAIYVGEVVLEIAHGGRGGGMIRFDDPGIRVATSAHLAAAGYALLAWLAASMGSKSVRSSLRGDRKEGP